MRYTLSLPETEQNLAEIEFIQAHQTWDVVLLDPQSNKTKKTFKDVKISFKQNILMIEIENQRCSFPASILSQAGIINVATSLGSLRLQIVRGGAQENGASQRKLSKSIKSSMPGKVIKILCEKGQTIEKGAPLLIIEAMKMENEIRASQSGKVQDIPIQPGQKIETGAVLIVLSAED